MIRRGSNPSDLGASDVKTMDVERLVAAPTAAQGRLPFVIRAERRDRAFKRSIVGLTILVTCGLVAATSAGRFAARMTILQGRALLNRIVGLPPDRAIVEKRICAERMRNSASARQSLAEVAAPGSAMDVFLHKVGMDAGSAVIRWGNVDRSIVLSSAVFEPDDARSIVSSRFVRSVWVIGLSFQKTLAMFLIPDTPEARDAAQRAGGRVVPDSVQTTNSWGCRGPEPDLAAPVRILVLGDSMMQGALVGDAETPPARLQAHILGCSTAPVSCSTRATSATHPSSTTRRSALFADRFRPQFVVISIAVNDFGDWDDPANWNEGEYWIDRIAEFCNHRAWSSCSSPRPTEFFLLARRDLTNSRPGHPDLQARRPQLRRPAGGVHRCADPPEERRDTPGCSSQIRCTTCTSSATGTSRRSAPTCGRAGGRARLLLDWDHRVLSGLAGPEPIVRHRALRSPADSCRRRALNGFSRFREGEAPSEPRRKAARRGSAPSQNQATWFSTGEPLASRLTNARR